MLSEAFNSISWLMTAAQRSHISHITRIYGTRLYSMCPSLPLMHADYFWRQSGHMRELICTQRWLQANKKGWRWAAPALLVLWLSLWVELLQTESETSLFYSNSLKYFSSSKHQNCFNVLLPSRWFVWFVLQGYIYDIVLMTAIFPGMFSPRGFFFYPRTNQRRYRRVRYYLWEILHSFSVHSVAQTHSIDLDIAPVIFCTIF